MPKFVEINCHLRLLGVINQMYLSTDWFLPISKDTLVSGRFPDGQIRAPSKMFVNAPCNYIPVLI